MTNELKIGLLVVLALGALGWLSAKSGSFGLGQNGTPVREITAIFTDVNGINEGSKVKMAGVDIGQVDAVQLQSNGTAVLRLSVRRNVALPADVTAQISTNGLIGERFVALVPGPAGALGQAGSLAESQTMIPSAGTADVQAIGTDFAQVANDLKEMTTTLRTVLGTPENAEKLQQIIDGLASFSGNIGGSNQLMQNLEVTAANFAKISNDLAQGKGTLGQLISGGTGDGTAGGTDLAGAMGSLNDIGLAAKEIRDVMAKINEGQGTLGKLVNDPETAQKLNDTLDSFGALSQRIEQIRTEVAFEGNTYTNEAAGGGEFSLTLAPRPTRFYQLGVSADGFASQAGNVNDRANPYFGRDFGKETKYTAQFGHVFENAAGSGQDVALRVGLKNSTGGLGVDTFSQLPVVGNKVKLSADLYDIGGTHTPGSDSPRLDLTARTDIIGKTVYGVVGYDNVLNQEYGSPKVGVGVRFQDDDLKYLLGQAL